MATLGKKVYVAMSGGVDSSVSAALLKEQGYDVTGAFIKVWTPDWLECNWRDEQRDAMRVAAALDIPLKTFDLSQQYKREVVDYMIGEYKAGRTPNPDVMCNKEVKFGAFMEQALAEGADFIATGHYAHIIDGQLHTGLDQDKDQSYFLWTLTKEQLEKSLFPVGELEKSKVRELALKFNIPVATKKDSQGICFLGKIDLREFLIHYLGEQPGKVLNEQAEEIGQHQGAIYYTLGQRHGFTLSKNVPEGEPHYVRERDLANNTLTISTKKPEGDADVATTEHRLTGLNISDESLPLEAQIRYHGKRYKCALADDTVTFNEPIAISPGQSVVFYRGDNCLGGGVVE